jgi:flavin-dependent dehydrogenase
MILDADHTPDTMVTVVGASVAGLFSAYHLARNGVPVRVYERQPELAPSPRTLIVTPAWLRLLDFDADEAILNRTDTFELISRGTAVRIPLREPDLIIERDAFLRLLAHQVRQVGGEIVFNHRLEALENHDAAPLLRFQNGRGGRTVRTPSVLGADGVHSTTARSISQDAVEHVGLIQARVALPADLPSNTVRCWFDRGSTRFFYWLIPESPHTGVVGLIADTQAQAKQALDRFLRDHDLEPIAYQQDAPVPMHPLRFSADSGNTPVLLAGDAAAQVKVTTVGGVVTGMRGGLAAARSILRATPYAAELRSLRWELNAHALVRHVLDRFTDADYDRLLRSLNDQAVRILSHYNRDELVRAIWRLVLAQPRWLGLGARALVQGFRRRS